MESHRTISGGHVLESKIERDFCKYAKSRGCYPVKFEDPSRRGANDRLLLGPVGQIVFVEFKRPGEKPRPDQIAYHKGLREMGFETQTIDNLDDGKKIVDDMIELKILIEHGFKNLDL